MNLTPVPGNATTICEDEKGRVYVRDGALASEIAGRACDGEFCTIIGPRYSRKSWLLHDVQAILDQAGQAVALFVDLCQIDAEEEGQFLAAFANAVQAGLHAHAGLPLPPRLASLHTAGLTQLLLDDLQAVRAELVLLLDHLEQAPQGPLRSLLTALRAVYEDPSQKDGPRLSAVISSSFSVAALSLGPKSPLNIARKFMIGDLDPETSGRLIDYILAAKKRTMSTAARERLVQATGGDHYLVAFLCERCVGATDATTLQITDVDKVVNALCDSDASPYPAPIEAVRAIEATPEIMLDIITVLKQGAAPAREVRREPGGEDYELILTGAVREEWHGEERFYAMRNEVYERFLRRHFRPERVARVLSMAGRWDAALSYLMDALGQNAGLRPLFLETVIDSVYTASNRASACRSLATHVRSAFGVSDVRVYLIDERWGKLALSSVAGRQTAVMEYDLLHKSAPEVKAFWGEDPELWPDESNGRQVAVPLRADDGDRLGVVVMSGCAAEAQTDEFLELLAVLRLAGRAVGAVARREQQVSQLAVLNDTGRKLSESLDLEHVLQTTVEGAIHAVPTAQKGSLYLWDQKRKKLIMRGRVGYPPEAVDLLQLEPGEGLAGRSLQERKPYLCPDVRSDPQHKRVDHPALQDVKSSMGVPLEVWGFVLGVLCVDNSTAPRAFHKRDLELLATFAAQAAIAILNVNLRSELYDLGLKINDGSVEPPAIFAYCVESIMRVTGASAANMLLLRDADNPEESVRQPPFLAVSAGFDSSYDERVRPRPDGLTHRVLRARSALAVGSPEEPPGINEVAYEMGTRAYLCLPMMVQNSIIGVLFVHYSRPHVFSENEKKTLSLFAYQAALAIENAGQRRDLQIMDSVAWMGIAFSSLAHRITQKAAAILNTTFGLLKKAGDPDIREGLKEIDDYARQVQEIPRSTLLPIKREDTLLDLADYVRNVVPRWCTARDHIQLTFNDCTPDTAMVQVDRSRLDMLLEILTTNAVRAAMQGEEPHTVRVETSVNDKHEVVVAITNSGREIPRDIQNLLFQEPIPKTDDAEGTGIGLLIARTIVSRYRGEIELVSSARTGTTFAFRLPLRLHM